MAYSPIEESYMNGYVATQFTTPEPEMEPTLLASANTGVTTDGGAFVGTRLKVPKPGQPTPEDRSKMAVGLLDTLAGALRGAAAQTIGLPGDIRSILDLINKEGADKYLGQAVLPTTEDMLAGTFLPPVLKEGVPNREERQGAVETAQQVGTFLPAPGVPEAAIQGTKAVIKGAKALGPKAAQMSEDYLRSIGGIADIVPAGAGVAQPARPNVVSTRFPTAVKATENPIESNLIIDYDTIKKDPVAFNHNMGLIESYPNFVSKADTVDGKAEDFITEVKDNLLFLHDAVPDATRQRSKLWYDGARKIVDDWTVQYDAPDDVIAGVLAVLSPQKDWFMNVSLGQRVLDISKTKQSFAWDQAMDTKAAEIWNDPKYQPVLDLVRNKTYGELKTPEEKALWLRTYDESYNPREHSIVNPEGTMGGVRLTDKGVPYQTGWGSLNEIGKAINIIDNPTVENISRSLGTQHKVRNFYNNIYDPTNPSGHVTIDTHAVAAGLLRPLSGKSREVAHNFSSNVKGEVGPKNSSVTGVQGTYGLYAEAYRRAAQERGVLPREMQSITWEAVRGLFPDSYKNAKNNQLVDNIWLQYKSGQISQEEARNAVLKTANGINPPEWEGAGLRGEAAPKGQPASNKGELSGAGVPTGPAGELGRRQRDGAAGKTKSVKNTTTLVEENK